ncbi:hypothetical protein Vadar_021386 [Vaccinium darrowii]|uniref:Uncharacterized protein n=1 Tax=Vaccinium darrowii TaxID=229202 RepID=A0ACB7ZD96_9ERIC|nr:hypothetical protein Vadar_021386 [Vaccinium darrowii]
MEARLVMHNSSPFPTQARRTDMRQGKQCMSIVSVLTRPVDDQVGKLSSLKTVYKDNLFDRIAINYMSQIVQASTGLTNNKSGYDSFVEATTGVWCNFDPLQQHEIVTKTLHKAIPRPILGMASSSFSSHHLLILKYVDLTYKYIVQVRESELNGRRERNVVHIKKCRFLEESNCVGMCINLCKTPSQKFMKDVLGMPVNMVPSKYVLEPPETAEDQAFKQPCYKLCNIS